MDSSVTISTYVKAGFLAGAMLLGLSGCNVYREATSARPDVTQPWRAIATDADRDRLRAWRKAWTEALPYANKSNAKLIASDPALFDPDRALGDAAIPVGVYACRIIKLGSDGTATADFSIGTAVPCRTIADGDAMRFHIESGAQRPSGLLFHETTARLVFLGTLTLGDEIAPLRYGLDAKRDMVGYVERIDDKRWRLVLPNPRFESKLDIIEISRT